MKHLKTFEKYAFDLTDTDGDGALEIELNDEEARIKENVLYEFMNVHFKVLYNTVSSKYYAVIQYPDIDKGTEQYVGWVIYGDSINDMKNKIRFQIKAYVQQYGEN